MLVLRRLRFDESLSRLRDVGALLAAAAIAPLGSIAFSWIGRSYVWADPNMPFYSGWDGWWRMNALGALTVLPVTLAWRSLPRVNRTSRFFASVTLAAIALVYAVATAMFLVPPGVPGVLALNLALTTCVLYAAGRFGLRGATLTGTLAALTVALVTAGGFGPFLALPREHRHVVLQLFELTFVVAPPVFGALVAERRAAQAQEARSDELRRSMQSAVPDITYRLHRDGTCLEMTVPPGANPPAPPGEVIGQSILERFPPAKREEFQRGIETALRERRLTTVEYALEIGGRRHVREARCVPHGDDEVLAIVRDITERKWAEGTTEFEARVLARVAAGHPSADVFAAIVEGMERLMPGTRCAVMGIEGPRLRVVTAPSLPAEYNAAVDGLVFGPGEGSCGSAAALGRTVVVEDIHTSPLWTKYRPLAERHGLRACWSVPVRDASDEVLGTFAIYDVRPRSPEARELELAERAAALAGIALDRERRAEALRRSQELLASIHRNVQEGLFRTSSDLRLIYGNLALARMFGWESPEAMSGFVLTDAVDSHEERRRLARIVGDRGQWLNEEVRFTRRDGAPFWGLLSGTVVLDPQGRVQWLDGAIADVTARKELEEQLRQSQKMEAVGKLAGGVAHDFNNLLTVILGYAETIQLSAEHDPTLRDQASQVVQAARRASGLTRQLLAYSRQQVLSPRVHDLRAVVDQLGGMLHPLIGEDVELAVVHRSGPCWVRVDRTQLEQVLLNLAVNARDAMPDGGRLRIRTSVAKLDEGIAGAYPELAGRDCAMLEVQDSGSGMSPDVQARAFDPFFTTKDPGRGTGLGLSTVLGIVRQSGGAVWIESAPGAGTTVRIALPIAESAGDPAPVEAGTTAAAPAHTVLVVEDDAAVRDLVVQVLRREGHTVLVAADGEAALSLSNGHAGELALVVSDLVMPRLGGRELATHLRRRRPGVRFLFVSGYPDECDAADSAVPEESFLHKPFTPDQLVQRVRECLVSSAGAPRAGGALGGVSRA